MNNNTVLWIYIVLLLVGGLIGFFKGKSKVSLIMSSAFAALLVVFAMRLAKTKKFMPAGMMLIVTIAALALRNLR